MKNWKTTVGGLITAVGVTCTQSDDPTLKAIGGLLGILGPAIIGIFAKDNNVTGGTTYQ